jgi:hypothetical protein
MYRWAQPGDLGQESAGYINPCGGRKWRTLEDGRIEIEGQGVPMYELGSGSFENVRRTWENWKSEFRSSARRLDVPLGWLVAIAAAETGFVSEDKELQARIVSADGYASVGIMQPLASVAIQHGYKATDRYDPQLNIDIGAKVLLANAKSKLGPAGFPVIAAMYNAGHACNPGNDQFNLAGYKGKYASTAIRGLNTAITHLDLSAVSWPLILGVGLGIAGVAAAGAIALGFVRPPRLG